MRAYRFAPILALIATTAVSITALAQAPIIQTPIAPVPAPAAPVSAPAPAVAPQPVQVKSPANISLQSFTWESSGRFEVQYTSRNQRQAFRGDLRDGERKSYPSKDGQTTIEIKNYRDPLFTVIAITSESDDTGYIFLLERPSGWTLMNRTPIRARKLDLMSDFEQAVEGFKKVTNFTLANIFRKMAEYFDKNPQRRLQSLLSDLENRDAAVTNDDISVLPRTGTNSRKNDQGVVVPGIPQGGGGPLDINPQNQRRNSGDTFDAPDPDNYIRPQPRNQQQRRRRNLDPEMDPPLPPGTIPGQGRDWVGEEAGRTRPDRQRNNDRYYPYGDQRNRAPQYAPPTYQAPQRYEPNFLERFFNPNGRY